MKECVRQYPCDTGPNQNRDEGISVVTHPINPRQILATATSVIVVLTIVESHTNTHQPKECRNTKRINKAYVHGIQQVRQIVFKFLFNRVAVRVGVIIIIVVMIIVLLFLHVTIIIIDIGGNPQNEHTSHTDPNGTIQIGSLVMMGKSIHIHIGGIVGSTATTRITRIPFRT